MRVFGSVCYYHILDQLRHKLEESLSKGILVGYGKCEKGYRVYNPQTKKIMLCRSVIFDESSVWKWDSDFEKQISASLSNETSDICHLEEDEQTENGQGIHSTVSSSGSRGSQTSTLSSTPIMLKSLEDIYARCYVCIVEPESYKEAASDDVKSRSWISLL